MRLRRLLNRESPLRQLDEPIEITRAERAAQSHKEFLLHPYPHLYRVSAAGALTGSVTVSSPQLPDIETAPPPEFDGPGGVWSPESLLCAAIADCVILTFRGVSRAAKFEWLKLECRVEGTLERVDGQAQFTRYATFATLTVPTGSDAAKARALLERAEHSCLISNSLRGIRMLESEIIEMPIE